jgi:hypothetical protein
LNETEERWWADPVVDACVVELRSDVFAEGFSRCQDLAAALAFLDSEPSVQWLRAHVRETGGTAGYAVVCWMEVIIDEAHEQGDLETDEEIHRLDPPMLALAFVTRQECPSEWTTAAAQTSTMHRWFRARAYVLAMDRTDREARGG